MDLDPNQLPDDSALLRGVISQLLEANKKRERKNAWLLAEVEALFRKLFRKRSEKLDPRQLELVFEAMRDLGISHAAPRGVRVPLKTTSCPGEGDHSSERSDEQLLMVG
jgi:hypothetical protein